MPYLFKGHCCIQEIVDEASEITRFRFDEGLLSGFVFQILGKVDNTDAWAESSVYLLVEKTEDTLGTRQTIIG